MKFLGPGRASTEVEPKEKTRGIRVRINKVGLQCILGSVLKCSDRATQKIVDRLPFTRAKTIKYLVRAEARAANAMLNPKFPVQSAFTVSAALRRAGLNQYAQGVERQAQERRSSSHDEDHQPSSELEAMTREVAPMQTSLARWDTEVLPVLMITSAARMQRLPTPPRTPVTKDGARHDSTPRSNVQVVEDQDTPQQMDPSPTKHVMQQSHAAQEEQEALTDQNEHYGKSVREQQQVPVLEPADEQF